MLVATITLASAPVLVDLAVSGQERPFAYFANDTFYYLEVARNWAHLGRFSFDQAHVTNGFHPLWQVALAVMFRAANRIGLSEIRLLYLVVVCGVLCIAVATALLLATLHRARSRLSPFLILLPIGMYCFLIMPVWVIFTIHAPPSSEGILPMYGTLWSYVNGMESPLVILAFSSMLWVVVAWPPRGWKYGVSLSGTMLALTLARLDHFAVVVGILAVLSFVAFDSRPTVALCSFAIAGGTLVVMLILYVLGNAHYMHVWFPVSGMLKSTFPYPTAGNLSELRILLQAGWKAPHNIDRFFREAQVLIPAFMAILFLAWVAISRWRFAEDRRIRLDTARGRLRAVLIGTAVGCLLLATYNFFFVPLWDQGHWYFPVSVLFVTLATADVCADRKFAFALNPYDIVVVTFAVGIVVFLGLERRPYHGRIANFYLNVAPNVRRDFASNPPKLLAFDDGIDAFSLGFPSMSAIGLALDPEAVKIKRQGRLVSLAVERGFLHFSTVNYGETPFVVPAATSDEIRQKLVGYFPGEDLRAFRFCVDYVDPSGAYVLIRIDPR